MKRKLILKIVLLLFIYSCEKEVFLELADREGAFIIVEADITDDGSRQWLRLTRSTSYYDQSTGIPVTGANVTITTDDNRTFSFYESTLDTLAGYYFNNNISENIKGRNLNLNISKDSKTYTAKSTWNALPGLDSVNLQLNPFSQLGFLPDTLYDIIVHFPEIPNKDNFYLFNLYVNDTLRTSRPQSKGLLSDRNLENYVSLAVLNISKSNLRDRDVLTLEMRSISEEYFNFYSIFFFQTDLSGNPFAGAPPANIPTNISEGGRGFFQASAVERKSIEYRSVMR
jgi:hypothetical protein